jgi:hypothetical protein
MVKYATRETVARALDAMETAAAYDQIDRALESASRTVEGPTVCNRQFWPEVVSLTFDWPDPGLGTDGYTLYLGENELVSVAELTNGDGSTIDAADYNLEPANEGPPYDSIEIVLGSATTLTAPSGTFQQAITATGVRGYNLDQRPAGALAAAISDTTGTTITVTDAHAIGVGDLLTIGSERLEVTGRALVDTGETLTATIDAEVSDRTVAVSDGTAFTAGEEITVGAETMLIQDIAGDNLLVRRQHAGSQLAAHLDTTAVYASRVLTVVRGFGGTTAATHSLAAAITAQVYPEPVVTAVVAAAIAQVLNEQAGYARGLGSGESVRSPSGVGVTEAMATARAAIGRAGRLFA